MNAEESAAWIERISRTLYKIDPMNTCCNVNEGMESEYIGEARSIADLLIAGIPLRQAVKLTFDQWFWEGCLEEAHRARGLDTLVIALTKPVRRVLPDAAPRGGRLQRINRPATKPTPPDLSQ